MPRVNRHHHSEDSESSSSWSNESDESTHSGSKKYQPDEVYLNLRETKQYIENGFRHNYEPKMKTDAAYTKKNGRVNHFFDHEFEVEAGLFKNRCQAGEVKNAFDVATCRVEQSINRDGLHVNHSVRGARGATQLAPVYAEFRALNAEAGATAQVGVQLGPVGASAGVSIDTGARARFDKEWVVGGEVLGTGAQIGHDGMKFSVFGTGFNIKW